VNGEKREERILSLGEMNVVAPEEVANNLDSVGGFESLKARLPPEESIKRIASNHRAIADPIRVKILWSLSFCDLCPCVLKEILDLSDSKLSYHLSILENAGHIQCRKEKNWRIYTLKESGWSSLELR